MLVVKWPQNGTPADLDSMRTMFRNGPLPVLFALFAAFAALNVISFMHLDQNQLGRLMRWVVSAGFVWFLCYTLWSGEFWLRGRSEPFTRKNEPIDYWIATTIAALFVGGMIAINILT
jgi:hypothetical protein